MRVLDNLYSMRYTTARNPVTFDPQPSGWTTVQIDVANSGTPIPEAERAMIFEPFSVVTSEKGR